MYVCVCNGITEKQAIAAAKEGCKKPLDIMKMCGDGIHCGKCCTQMREIINDNEKKE